MPIRQLCSNQGIEIRQIDLPYGTGAHAVAHIQHDVLELHGVAARGFVVVFETVFVKVAFGLGGLAVGKIEDLVLRVVLDFVDELANVE